MGLSHLDAGERIDLQGSTVVVAVPLYGAHDLFVRCLSSLLRNTPQSAPILIADDCSPDPASEAWVRELDASGNLDHRVIWRRNPENVGFVVNCNRAINEAGRADIVLVNSDVEVAEGWLEGLGAAAHSDSLVATATAMTNHGTIVSVPYRNNPVPALPQGITFEDAASRVRARSLKLYPELPTAIGHCFYIRRTAIDLVGSFDEAFSPGYGEEADFSQRCVSSGLRHVLADDVLVYHRGQASFGVDGGRNPRQDRHEKIINARYPYYEAAVELAGTDQVGPLSRALTLASQAVLNSSVTIDGTCLGRIMTGTQVHTLELIAALERTSLFRLRVLLPDEVGEEAQTYLDQHPHIEQLSLSVARESEVRIDHLVHRPNQVDDPKTIALLSRLGNRVVITHQDLIAYRNPSYFPSAKAWKRHRQVTRESLALADRVVFFSEHAERDALGEELVPPMRSDVVHIGVDHRIVSPDGREEPPFAHPELQTTPFLLVLGTDFRHKNRLFALRLFEALRERHGWNGKLVFAGPTVSHGSSVGEEVQWLASRPQVAEHLIVLPAVTEPVKNWLMSHAAGVLYPTTYEGFGLLPFEAAHVGTPPLFAPVTSLADLLATVPAAIVPWDVEESSARTYEILTNSDEAKRIIDAVREVSRQLTWDATASQLADVYRRTLSDRGRDSRSFIGDSITKDARYWGLRNAIGPAGLSLVEPEDPLLPVPAQRTIAGLARRKATRNVFLAGLAVLRRITPGAKDEPAESERADDA